MIFYTPEPFELFSQGAPVNTVMLKLPSGGHILAEPCEYNKLRVLNVVSTEPMDFLNSRYQPGNIIELQSSLQSQ